MAIGAIAGLVHGVAKKHQGVLLPPGTELTFVLDRTFLSKHITPRLDPTPHPPHPSSFRERSHKPTCEVILRGVDGR